MNNDRIDVHPMGTAAEAIAYEMEVTQKPKPGSANS